jgi:hypothetical protein
MTGPSDFADDELGWLSMIERTAGVMPPDRVAVKLLELGVAEPSEFGLRLTDRGSDVVLQARNTGRLAKPH